MNFQADILILRIFDNTEQQDLRKIWLSFNTLKKAPNITTACLRVCRGHTTIDRVDPGHSSLWLSVLKMVVEMQTSMAWPEVSVGEPQYIPEPEPTMQATLTSYSTLSG